MKRKVGCLLVLVSMISILFCTPAFAEPSPEITAQNERIVTVEKVDGCVQIFREGVEKMRAKDGISLVSGDKIRVGKYSHLYLKLDSDKYLMAGPGTVFCIEAGGTEKDSITQIEISCGEVIHRIDNKLSRNSSYKIVTGNSVTSLRGTLVRTKTMDNPNQTNNTRTDVFEGTAEMHTGKSDGTGDSTPVMVNQTENPRDTIDLNNIYNTNNTNSLSAGETLMVDSNSIGEITCTMEKLDYSKQSSATLQFIYDSTATGRIITIPLEEIKQMIDKKAEEEKKAREEEEEKEQAKYYLSNSSNSTDSSRIAVISEYFFDTQDNVEEKDTVRKENKENNVIPATEDEKR